MGPGHCLSTGHVEPGHFPGFITTAILPASSPVERVDGQWKPTKKAAEASACLEAIKQLHKVWSALSMKQFTTGDGWTAHSVSATTSVS